MLCVGRLIFIFIYNLSSMYTLHIYVISTQIRYLFHSSFNSPSSHSRLFFMLYILFHFILNHGYKANYFFVIYTLHFISFVLLYFFNLFTYDFKKFFTAFLDSLYFHLNFFLLFNAYVLNLYDSILN